MESELASQVGNLPAYMIFAVLVIWMITNFVLKYREGQNSNKDGDTKNLETELLTKILERLNTNGEQFNQSLVAQNRVLEMCNALTVTASAIQTKANELYQAHLGDNARLPNGGLKWYNDPQTGDKLLEAVESLDDTTRGLKDAVQTLTTTVERLSA